LKIFTEEDIDKEIEGFSDTILKRFLLRVGINFINIEETPLPRTVICTFLLMIKDQNDFIDFIAFMDIFHRNCKVFKFAGALHCECLNGEGIENDLYKKLFYKTAQNDNWIRSLSERETKRLEKLFNISRPEEFIYLQSKSETYEDIKNSIISVEKREKEINYGVHASHCCFIHGCKYGDDDCPVEKGEVKQEYICESCQNDGINSIDELEAMLVLGLKKCSECGHYYKV
jgi:hypothetical protein